MSILEARKKFWTFMKIFMPQLEMDFCNGSYSSYIHLSEGNHIAYKCVVIDDSYYYGSPVFITKCERCNNQLEIKTDGISQFGLCEKCLIITLENIGFNYIKNLGVDLI